VAVSTLCVSSSATSSAITLPPFARFMPRTPRAPRPIGRTSFSSKRTALPSSENIITSCLPSVIATPTRQSPSSRSTAMIPEGRGREKSASEVFFTTPSCVAKKMKRSRGIP
jgi:hypothetical protein